MHTTNRSLLHYSSVKEQAKDISSLITGGKKKWFFGKTRSLCQKSQQAPTTTTHTRTKRTVAGQCVCVACRFGVGPCVLLLLLLAAASVLGGGVHRFAGGVAVEETLDEHPFLAGLFSLPGRKNSHVRKPDTHTRGGGQI